MAQTETYFKREDVVSKGKFMQIRPTVKLLTHAISQCLPITNWDETVVLSEQNPGSQKFVITADLRSEALH